MSHSLAWCWYPLLLHELELTTTCQLLFIYYWYLFANQIRHISLLCLSTRAVPQLIRRHCNVDWVIHIIYHAEFVDLPGARCEFGQSSRVIAVRCHFVGRHGEFGALDVCCLLVLWLIVFALSVMLWGSFERGRFTRFTRVEICLWPLLALLYRALIGNSVRSCHFIARVTCHDKLIVIFAF